MPVPHPGRNAPSAAHHSRYFRRGYAGGAERVSPGEAALPRACPCPDWCYADARHGSGRDGPGQPRAGGSPMKKLLVTLMLSLPVVGFAQTADKMADDTKAAADKAASDTKATADKMGSDTKAAADKAASDASSTANKTTKKAKQR